MNLKDIVKAWDDFWFRPVSPIPIALFRIAIGFLALVLAVSYLPNLHMWLGAKGIISLQSSLHVFGRNCIQLFALLPQGDGWITVFLIVFMTASFMLMIGLCTRPSTIVVWLGALSLYHRCPNSCNGGEALLWIFTFYLIFCPAGAAISVDRLLQVAHGKQTGPPAFHPPFGQRLIQLYLMIVYLSCFYWKAVGPMWADGTAVYYAVREDHLWRFSVPYLYEHMWTLKLLTWGTLVVECGVPLLIWIREVRYVVMAVGILFHLGLEFSMNIPLFQWVTLSAYLTFVEPEDVKSAIEWIRIRAVGFIHRIRLIY